jgi:peptide deformylase
MINKMVKPDDPVLVKIAQEIPLNQVSSKETKDIIEQILDVAYGRRKNREKPTVVGLAAPQIGISKRVIAVDIGASGTGGLSELKLYINPEIVWSSDETEEWCEGCWSTDRVAGVVERPLRVRIKAISTDGRQIEEEHEGYVARIFQHEIDHLNGNEFVSHIKDPDKLHWVEEDEWAEYKNRGGWRNWLKKCPFEKWEKIKGLK